MELGKGKVGVVTGAGSGIGLALATALANEGLSIVLADVQKDALDEATERISALGVDTMSRVVDVSKDAEVQALAAAAVERFGAVHIVCNNAGVAGRSDPWGGPLSSWEWVMGVNFWGVVHGIRAFLPLIAAAGGGHIVNTASIAGLYPGFSPAYDASKHGVVAISESLYNTLQLSPVPIGVSCLCPGWVHTKILDADRNWPAELGALPDLDPMGAVFRKYVETAIDEGMPPAAVADRVVDAVKAGRFWVFPHLDFLEVAVERFHQIAEQANPVPPEHMPGLPPRSQIIAELLASLE
jgi:NAD(P)-dependent dehydrogenase (short-subunit alcohol dehydrogenase family)